MPEGHLHALAAEATSVTELGNVVVGWLEAHGFALPSIYLEQAGHLRCVAVRGYWQMLDGFSLDHGVLAKTFRTGSPHLVPDVLADPEYIAAVPGVVAELCLPLRYAGDTVGGLNVESLRSLTLDDLATVQHAAACFEHRLDELGGPDPESPWQRLARLSASLADLTEPQAIAEFAVQAACEVTDFHSAVLVVKTGDTYAVQAACGSLGPALASLPAEALPLIASWTDSATSAFTAGEIAGTGFEGHEPLRHAGVAALACAALASNGARHGFLMAAGRQPVEVETHLVHHLEIVAAHTSSSLHIARALAALRNQASQDALTGLGHGATFHTHLEAVLRDAQRPTAVLLIDLDHFKQINDTHGHAIGDRVLRESAQILRAALRTDDRLYRVGGDEFAAIVPVNSALEAEDLARRLNETARRAGQARVSIGITIVPAGKTPKSDAVLSQADFALYETKTGGRDGATLYSPGLRREARERAEIAAELAHAVDRGQLYLEYQPIVDLGGSGVFGVEALVRWRHPTRGIVAPLDFITLAEQGGHIVEIGRWVVDEACRQLALWSDAAWARDDMKLAVNVSASELGPEYVDGFSAALQRHGVPADRLVVEVTESVFIDEYGAVEPLQRLRDLGVHVAVDDFGTGYSSLSYLHRLPIDIVKIDRAFVAQLEDPSMHAVAEAIVQLSRKLGLSLVAEGVERAEQIDLLRALGCEYAQGFLWSRPVLAADVPGLCRTLAADPVTARAAYTAS